MWRPAIVRFGAIAIAVACGGRAHDSSIGNRGGRANGDLTAAYYCSIQDGGYKYPRFPCAVREIDGRWMLAKLGGSQRFRGVITPTRDGFTFDGELYCPWGDCVQPLHGEFVAAGHGRLTGTFRDTAMSVLLEPAPDAAFGGASYGGDGYGGFGYGGASYGGPLQMQRNRRP